MIDITSIDTDLNIFDSQVAKATNVLSIQIGRLEYLPEFGIDLEFFLEEDFRFQNESFKSYLIERLANNSINVSSLTETLENLFSEYNFELAAGETGGGLVAG